MTIPFLSTIKYIHLDIKASGVGNGKVFGTNANSWHMLKFF